MDGNLDPLGSTPGTSVGQRGAFVGMGNTAWVARELVRGREARGGESAFNPLTGRGQVAALPGDYAKAQRLGHFVSELCVETFGGLGSTLVELIKEAAAMRGNKLTHGEYEAEATWSTRKFTPFVMQRISVAIQIAAASEIRQALGMSLALSAA